MQSEFLFDLIWLGLVVAMLLVASVSGLIVAKRHNARLDAGEQQTQHIVMTDLRSFPGGAGSAGATLVAAEAVIAVDYFRSWLTKFVNIVGGEAGIVTRTAIRARREALLRLKRQAESHGHNAVCNLRVETCNIRGSEAAKQKAGVILITVLASGTAYTRPS